MSPRSLANSTFAHIACLVFLIVVIYANTLNAPFQWDENFHIVINPIIKDLHYFAQPSKARGLDQYDFVVRRYIAFLTFALNYRVHGLSVTGYHIVNIAIHIANTILVYFLVLLTFRTPFMKGKGLTTENTEKNSEHSERSFLFSLSSNFSVPSVINSSHDSRSLIAFFSAAIFAVHPVQTEAVTYIMQRFASLTTFFYLLSLVLYIKFRLALTTESTEESFDIKKPKKFSRSAQSFSLCSLWLILSFFSAVLAMKTKENAFTLPFVIVLYEFCFFPSPMTRNRSPITRVFYLAPFLLTLAIIPLTLTGVHGLDPRTYEEKLFSRWDYFFTQFRVTITYLRLLFLPVNQNFVYDYPVYHSLFEMPVLLSFVFLATLFSLGVFLAKGKGRKPVAFRLIGFGILWFFITLSVESSIIPLWMLINEYRMYLPSVGAIICIVTGAFLLKEKLLSPKAGSIIVAVLVLSVGILSVTTYFRNELWTDKIKLWEDTAKKSPGNARVLSNLGYAYQARNMPDKAMEQYLIAIKVKPDFALAHYNLGIVYRFFNMPNKAMEQYLIAIKVKPDYAEAYNNLGGIYQDFNMPDKAMEQYLIAIKVKPDFAEAYFNLGLLYFNMGQLENARKELITGLNIKPDDQKAQQLLQMISR